MYLPQKHLLDLMMAMQANNFGLLGHKQTLLASFKVLLVGHMYTIKDATLPMFMQCNNMFVCRESDCTMGGDKVNKTCCMHLVFLHDDLLSRRMCTFSFLVSAFWLGGQSPFERQSSVICNACNGWHETSM